MLFLVVEWNDYASARADRTGLAALVALHGILGGGPLSAASTPTTSVSSEFFSASSTNS